MNLRLTNQIKDIEATVKITGSKSESNRLLQLRALYPNILLKNVSNSDDSRLMQKALDGKTNIIDIHHAGTAMRFLTSYLAVQEGSEVVLTGSERMKERPIKILVDALKQLGASITYEEKEGYPPLRIKGNLLQKDEVTLKANISSQYISSLLLIAPKLKNGLTLKLDGEITSRPYLQMTLSLLSTLGVENTFNDNTIKVSPTKSIHNREMVVESDWSSASYFYGIAALSKTADITLSSYKKDSLQGDSVLATIYEHFGVETIYHENTIQLIKKENCNQKKILELDLTHAPDIAQTIAVSCFGNNLGCHLTGLHTLKIKETDRLEALKTELTKLGAHIEVSDKDLKLFSSSTLKEDTEIETYNDHRMAMAFAPLALKIPIKIKDANVVSKSYPDFWNDLKGIGIYGSDY